MGKPDRHMQKNEIGHYLTPNTKINSKWIKHLILRPEAIKTPQKKTGNKLLDVGIGKDFRIWHQKQSQQKRNKQVGRHQLQSKRNHKENKKSFKNGN